METTEEDEEKIASGHEDLRNLTTKGWLTDYIELKDIK